MNGFYALLRRALGTAWRGPRGDRRPDSSMHFYAPWLCNLSNCSSDARGVSGSPTKVLDVGFEVRYERDQFAHFIVVALLRDVSRSQLLAE